MKKIVPFLFVILGITTSYSQKDDRPINTGDNFSLEGALALFKNANSLEEFEKNINSSNNPINNLDLNNDGTIDYINVEDMNEGNAHVIILSTFLKDNEKQDIATIQIEKTGDDYAVLQIEGDKDLYAENTIIEPTAVKETMKGGKNGPNISEIDIQSIAINVWGWPSVRFLFAPTYVVWHSPYRWGFYPRWWRPWRPILHATFYANCAPHRVIYRPVAFRRVEVARRIYMPRRSYSTFIIHNRRGAPRFENPRRERREERRVGEGRRD